jgi:alpha-tubulin suppressor-like RCC1 family protein
MRQTARFEFVHHPSLLLLAMVVATSGCGDSPVAPGNPDASTALAAQATVALSFRQISVSMYHSCGVTYEDRAYCWGNNGVGQLGDGTTNTQRTRPVPVAGGLHFLMLSAGFDHTCGVTTENRVYCWGSNSRGQSGDGSFLSHSTPVPVAGGRRFRLVSAGYVHTCAVTPFNAAFCWGNNGNGRLGDGTTTERLVPVAVKGGLQFRRVVAGGFHTCGVTTSSRAYCWGRNEQGQLGDGTLNSRTRPVPVAGGLGFRWATTGTAQIAFKWQSASCGVTTGDRAYCWGSNLHGQLGDGSLAQRTRPVAVAGALRFAQVNTGGGHTCGITLTNLAYCWGWNGRGQVGDGTTSERSRPVAVAGRSPFRAVTTGGGHGGHTCALRTDDSAYCWGFNVFGQLGDGSTTNRSTPVPVLGPS